MYAVTYSRNRHIHVYTGVLCILTCVPPGLQDVALPPPTYNLVPYLLESGHLSALQLEGVLYACQRHLTLLPGGSRAGFFIGDGAGVGKGRQVCMQQFLHMLCSTCMEQVVFSNTELEYLYMCI